MLLYRVVSNIIDYKLVDKLEEYVDGSTQTYFIQNSNDEILYGWPDEVHLRKMRINRRHYFKISDIVKVIFY